jgi:hypothetical protein
MGPPSDVSWFITPSRYSYLRIIHNFVIIPICSMYGIFTYIWVIFRAMLVNIAYMEHMGNDPFH